MGAMVIDVDASSVSPTYVQRYVRTYVHKNGHFVLRTYVRTCCFTSVRTGSQCGRPLFIQRTCVRTHIRSFVRTYVCFRW